MTGAHPTNGQRGEETELRVLIPLRDAAAFPQEWGFLKSPPPRVRQAVWLLRNVQGPQLPSGVDFKIKKQGRRQKKLFSSSACISV